MGKDGNKQRFDAIARQSRSPSSHNNTLSFQRGGGGGRGGARGRGGRGGGRGGRGGSGFFNKKRDQKPITFDNQKRIEFVTGFKKRKDERRFKAKIRAKEELRQERVELMKSKAQQRQNIEDQYEQIRQMKKAEMGIVDDADDQSSSESENEKNNEAKQAEAAATQKLEEEFDGGMFEKE